MNVFIILFPDGSMMFFNRQQEKKCFREDAKQFMVHEKQPMVELLEWSAKGFKDHGQIKSVTWE